MNRATHFHGKQMRSTVRDLISLISTLQKINLAQPESNIIDQVTPLVKQVILQPKNWMEDRFYEIDEAQGFGSHLIYENADHTLAVIITSWLPHRETPPHDHDTWAVIGCVKGAEQNTLWDRHDDGSVPGYAHITRGKSIMCRPGDIVTMKRTDIHTVSNVFQHEISISLHVYGKNFNYTHRHQFDPEKRVAKPFIVRQVLL